MNTDRESFQADLVDAILQDTDVEFLYEMAFNYLMNDFDSRTEGELAEIAQEYAPQLMETN